MKESRALFHALCTCAHLLASLSHPLAQVFPPHPNPPEPSRTLQNRLHLQKASFLFIIFSCLPYDHACYHNILMPSRKAAHDKVGISPSWISLSPPLTLFPFLLPEQYLLCCDIIFYMISPSHVPGYLSSPVPNLCTAFHEP